MAATDGCRRYSERRDPDGRRGLRERTAEVARHDRRDAHASAGLVKNIKNPMHLSDTPLDTYAAPPRLGEHTREILTGLLGYSASEIEELARSETI